MNLLELVQAARAVDIELTYSDFNIDEQDPDNVLIDGMDPVEWLDAMSME